MFIPLAYSFSSSWLILALCLLLIHHSATLLFLLHQTQNCCCCSISILLHHSISSGGSMLTLRAFSLCQWLVLKMNVSFWLGNMIMDTYEALFVNIWVVIPHNYITDRSMSSYDLHNAIFSSLCDTNCIIKAPGIEKIKWLDM